MTPCTPPDRLRRGFTLIELIIIVAIIGIIAAAVFVAVDPARRLHASRNGKRWSDVTAILHAIKQYQADNDGGVPSTAVAIDSASGSVQVIGTAVPRGACGTQIMAGTNTGVTGLSTDVRPYLKNLPYDPRTGSTANTRYYINKDQYGIVVVGACDSEGEGSGGGGTAPTIEVTQ